MRRCSGVLPVGLALMEAACGWDHLDAISAAAPSVDGQAPEGAPRAGSNDASDANDMPEAPPADADSSSLACTGGQSAVREWTFDSATDGWTLSADPGVQGSVAWAANIGLPAPGALQVDVSPGTHNGAWLEFATPVGNLSGRTLSAWVWLDAGPSPHLKFFVQTGAQYAWADNGTVLLSPRTWTCVSMVVSSPSYSRPSYDPTNVIVLGFEMLGSAPFRLYVDTVRYY